MWGGAVFAQDAEPPISVDEPQKTPVQPETQAPPLLRYFQWGKPLAVRKDFILSTLSFLFMPGKQGISEELFTFHWSFLPFMSVGLGFEVGGLFGEALGFPGFAGIALQAGFVLPITARIKVFGDFVLDLGYGTASVIPNSWFGLNIGFDLGLTVMADKDFGLEFKYKGVVLPDGRYQNAVGFGWLWNFWL